ncbi:MAG: type II secretion system protein GspG [Halieaceae bacterium]
MASIHPKRTELEFRDLREFSPDIVCGEYNAISVMGEETGYLRFILRSGKADKRPSDSDYAIYCSKKPAEALEKLFGIGPVDNSNRTLMQIQADFGEISAALASYEMDMFVLPKGKSGLSQLTASRMDVSPPRKFRQGGYLKEIPNDPWDRAYLYESSQLSGVKGSYEIKSLGADGLPGGSGQNADVSTDQMGYLQHIINN